MWQERDVPLTLVLVTPGGPSPLAVQTDARVVVLGRGPTADVRLPDPSVSARHACLKKRGKNYLLSDEGSQNGTAVFSAAAPTPVYLAPGSPRVVQDGDHVSLGHVELQIFFDNPPVELSLVADPAELPRRLVQVALRERGHDPGDEELDRALRELESAADENLHAEAPPELPLAAPVIDEREEHPRSTDLVIGLAALLILAGGLYALAWLVG